ncbi:MAG: ATP-dependent Clp protease ATP-binding subunit [Patescibacteria group bacterium]|nr:ATP-dependent Clp protease ATP-binding subunit [Patescibacteria group bacterium]
MNKFTNHLEQVLGRAKSLAVLNSRAEISVEDLIRSLIMEKGSLAREVLIRSGLEWQGIGSVVEITNNYQEKNLDFEKELAGVLPQTITWAAEYESNYVGTEHLLCALVVGDYKNARQFFIKNKVNINQLADNLKTVLNTNENLPAAALNLNSGELETTLNELMKDLEDELPLSDAEPVIKKSLGAKLQEKLTRPPQNKKSILDVFARNLTDAKIQETIDPVIGREKEIERIIQILTRRTKNNPVLLGDAGVGKTAIVEGLAKKILAGDVPDVLLNKKIYALDLNLLIAGTVMRGEFEGRLKQVIDEIKSSPNTILFIDEIHMIAGAGAVNGAMDAGNILKPALARGEIRCLGATTYEDYKKYIEEDAALERRFQPVSIPEPTAEETEKILKGIKNNYEKHHQVKISDEAIAAAVKLSVRYLPEKFLPDKAIDLLDEAAARLKVKMGLSPLARQIRLLEEKTTALEEKKIKAIRAEKYSDALIWRTEEEKTLEKIAQLQAQSGAATGWLGEITGREIAAVVAEIKQIPLTELTAGTDKELLDLEKKLGQFIFGQAEALKEISFFIKRSRAGLTPANRPLGSFIFAGPSGIGKTETAKVLAEVVFGSDKRLIRIDMSEFAEGFNVSRLIGSPPGYVGFKEGGKLTEAVRRQPYSVVLFDEMEKAHPQVFGLLLQILEDGHLTDATGKIINFKNTIIILTSNLGQKDFSANTFGFDKNLATDQEKQEQIQTKIMEILKKEMRPELLNRVDKIIVFKSLNEKVAAQIAEKEMKNIAERLQDKKIKLSWSPAAVKFLASQGFSLASGAREIRQVIQNLVEAPLIEKILMGKIFDGEVKIDVKNKKIIIK